MKSGNSKRQLPENGSPAPKPPSWPDPELQEPRLRELGALLERIAKRNGLEASTTRAANLETELAQALKQPLTVLVVGPFSSGKSSLVNALFGRQLFAVGLPETTRDTNVVLVSDEEGAPIPEALVPKKGKVVTLASEAFPPGSLFVDTPGFNSRLDAHDRIAAKALAEADVILACADAQQGPSRSMLEFLDAHRRLGVRTCLLLTKADLLAESDLANQRAAAETVAQEHGLDRVLAVSVEREDGLAELTSYLKEEILPSASRIRRERIRHELAALAAQLEEVLASLLENLEADTASLDRAIDKLRAERQTLQRDLDSRRLAVLQNLKAALRELTQQIRDFGQAKAAELAPRIATGDVRSQAFFRALEARVLAAADRFSELVAREVGEHFSLAVPAVEAEPVLVEKIRSIAEIAVMIAAAVALPLGGLGNILEALGGKVLATILERTALVSGWVQGELERATETVASSFHANGTDSLRELDRNLDEILTKRFLPELEEKEQALAELREQRREHRADVARRRQALSEDLAALRKVARPGGVP